MIRLYDKYLAKQNQLIKESRERRNQYLVSHPDLPEKQKILIESGDIGEGLTKEQINIITGMTIPTDEIKPTTEYGTDEVWIYKVRNAKHYLYFEDDILIKEKRRHETISGKEEY